MNERQKLGMCCFLTLNSYLRHYHFSWELEIPLVPNIALGKKTEWEKLIFQLYKIITNIYQMLYLGPKKVIKRQFLLLLLLLTFLHFYWNGKTGIKDHGLQPGRPKLSFLLPSLNTVSGVTLEKFKYSLGAWRGHQPLWQQTPGYLATLQAFVSQFKGLTVHHGGKHRWQEPEAADHTVNQEAERDGCLAYFLLFIQAGPQPME